MEETDIVPLERLSNNHGIGCQEEARSDGYWTLLRDYASSQTVIKLKLVKNSAASGTKRPRMPSSPPLQPIKRIKMMYSTTPEMPSLSTRISTVSSTSFDDRSSSQIVSQYSHPTTISTESHPTLPLKKRPRKAISCPKSCQVTIDTLTRLDAILPSAQDRESHQVDDSSYIAYRNILLGALESEKFNLCKPKYDLQGFVGCGASGLVVRAQRNGKTVVIKMIAEVNNSAHSKYHKELDNLARLDHTNIISVQDAFTCPSQDIRMNAQDEPIKTPRIFCLVMPYMEETLFDLLARHREQRTTKLGGLPLDMVQSVFAQIAAGLAHIHSRGMSHNDIKEENTLISLQGDHVYSALCDLGHARMTKTQNEPISSSPIHQCDLVDCNYKTEYMQDTRLYIIYGTAAMTPPEMQPNYRLRQQALHSSSGSSQPEFEKFQGFEADVYALGLVLHSMVFGKLPEECHTWPKTMEALKLIEQKPSAGQCAVHIGGSNQLRSLIPSSLRHLLNGMLHRDHRQRLRMDQVLEHPWVRSFIPSS